MILACSNNLAAVQLKVSLTSSFVHSLNENLQSFYFIAGTVLGAKDTGMTTRSSSSQRTHSLVGGNNPLINNQYTDHFINRVNMWTLVISTRRENKIGKGDHGKYG